MVARNGTWIWLLVTLGLGLAMLAPVATATPWRLSTGVGAYQLEQAQGRALEASGAVVVLRSIPGTLVPFGSSLDSIDAADFAGGWVELSATLLGDRPGLPGALWLRVDAADGRVLEFANTQAQTLASTAPGERRIVLAVPKDAVRIAFGTVLRGPGVLRASRLRLQRTDPPADAWQMRPMLESVLALLRDHALAADRVDWQARAREVDGLGPVVSRHRAYAIMRGWIAALDDGHSFVKTPEQVWRDRDPTRMVMPTVAFDADGLATIRLPGLQSAPDGREQRYVGELQRGIAAAAAGARCGWVLDLRGNHGGTMWPMLAGLKALLGPGELGYFESRQGRSPAWHAGDHVELVLAPEAGLERAPLAVLYGARTASAAEAVAIALRGRAASRAFGMPTAGLSTGNRTLPLPDGGLLGVAASRELDRTGRAYTGPIDPEVLMPEERAESAARAWLLSQCDVARQ